MFRHLLVVVIFLGGVLASLLDVKATATPLGWMDAIEGVRVGESMAFPGCAPARSINDSKAFKLAVLRAQSNIARTKRITVSGMERSESGSKDSKYSFTVTETADGFLRPVVVMQTQITTIDGVSQLCVLVTETTDVNIPNR